MAYYSPYKLIGVVCDGKPFQLQRLGEEVFLLTSTDSCFQIFRMDKLSVVMVSRTLPDKIDAFHVSTVNALLLTLAVFCADLYSLHHATLHRQCRTKPT